MDGIIVMLRAAAPWIVIGLLFAALLAIRAGLKAAQERTKAQDCDYSAEGMSLGLCLGLCLEISFGDNSGMGLALGMLIGLAAGTGIRKTAYDEEREEEVRSGSAASGLRKQTMPDPAKPVPSFGKPV